MGNRAPYDIITVYFHVNVHLRVNVNVPENDTRAQSRVIVSSNLQETFLQNYLPQELRSSAKCYHFPKVGHDNGHAPFGYVHLHVYVHVHVKITPSSTHLISRRPLILLILQ